MKSDILKVMHENQEIKKKKANKRELHHLRPATARVA